MYQIFSHNVTAFGEGATFRVWAPVKWERDRAVDTFKGWARSFERSRYRAGHPWYVINLSKMVIRRLPLFDCFWRTKDKPVMTPAEVWDHFKLAKCEFDYLDPENDPRLMVIQPIRKAA